MEKEKGGKIHRHCSVCPSSFLIYFVIVQKMTTYAISVSQKSHTQELERQVDYDSTVQAPQRFQSPCGTGPIVLLDSWSDGISIRNSMTLFAKTTFSMIVEVAQLPNDTMTRRKLFGRLPPTHGHGVTFARPSPSGSKRRLPAVLPLFPSTQTHFAAKTERDGSG